jgi:hypothetical protein
VGVKDSAQVFAIAFPVAVDPVNQQFQLLGGQLALHQLRENQVEPFITPAGNPASIAASAKT